MTFEFSCSSVPRNDSATVMGCGQVSIEPKNWKRLDGTMQRCRQCLSPMFPIESETEMKCPICEPSLQFSKNVFAIGEGNKRNDPIVCVFDLTLPRNTMHMLLNELCEALEENQTLIILTLSHNVLFASVSCGTLTFYSMKQIADVTNINHFAVTKSSLKDIVMPAFDSVYSLCPPEMPETVDVFLGLEMVLAAAGNQSVITLCFLVRPSTSLNVSQADTLGKRFAASHSVVHFCTSNDFRKYTAIARHCLGHVLSVSFMPKGILTHLIQQPRISQLEISAPRSIEFVKVIGCSGKMNLSTFVSRLELTDMSAGGFQFTYDSERSCEQKVNFVIFLVTNCHSFLYLYEFPVADSITNNSELMRRLEIKKFAKDILEFVWRGGALDVIWKKKFTTEMQSLLHGTCIDQIGRNMQRDVMQLYYLLDSFVYWPLSKRHVCSPDGYQLLFVPPTVFILADKTTLAKVDMAAIIPYLYECRIINDIHAFVLIAQQHGIEIRTQDQ